MDCRTNFKALMFKFFAPVLLIKIKFFIFAFHIGKQRIIVNQS